MSELMQRAMVAPVAVKGREKPENMATCGQAMKRRTSLSIPPGIPIGAWRNLGQHIHSISSSSAWWLGDWLLYGQEEYPSRYKHAVAQTSLDYQTLRNYAWVARRFESPQRVSGLSFQHHAEVAGLAADERSGLLKRALELGWSRNELRRQVKARKELAGVADGKVPARLKMRPNDDQRQRWQEAAEHEAVDLLAWITKILDDVS
ncbi:LmbU family transcriptional regulator [Streptomyces lunaelactis]|uniref:LmbU family transcriptional regulator n=1 Tax=Streptomyces lunaelactis TaxID=1535768 RepID=UPI0020C7DDCA|nr:LmbU family transcriptional regulator [Streptomyces lunaelactis]